MAKKRQTKKRDLYQEVTDAIVAELEKGVAPWVKPWNQEYSGMPRNGNMKPDSRIDGSM